MLIEPAHPPPNPHVCPVTHGPAPSRTTSRCGECNLLGLYWLVRFLISADVRLDWTHGQDMYVWMKPTTYECVDRTGGGRGKGEKGGLSLIGTLLLGWMGWDGTGDITSRAYQGGGGSGADWMLLLSCQKKILHRPGRTE